MARAVRSLGSFIGQIGAAAGFGGIVSKVSGSESYEAVTSADADKYSRLQSNSPEDDGSVSSEDAENEGAGSDTIETEVPTKRGTLSKWTNYLHGWQERYFVVSSGILSYYRSEFDTQYGCRGSISLHKVKVILHEFDELRFDIRARDCIYFLRATTVYEREQWVEAIEGNKKFLADSGFSLSSIRRQGSILSLSGLSQASTSSFKVGHDLQTKLAELETYRDILCRQVDTLQAYFDVLSEPSTSSADSERASSTGEMANGISVSVESVDELPEADSSQRGSSSAAQSPPSGSPLPHSVSETHTPSTTHHYQLQPGRYPVREHRRTGSDPFSFKQPYINTPTRNNYHHHKQHAQFVLGGSSGASSNTDISSIDFRGEAITFKATTAGILASLANCIELMNKREEYWQKKFEKEQERRRKADLAAHAAMNGPRVKAFEYAGPDFEEGPNSVLNEEEFFDALEMAYQYDEVEAGTSATETASGRDGAATEAPPQSSDTETEEEQVDGDSSPEVIMHKSASGITHRMTPLVDEKVSEYAKYIFEPVDTNWSVVHEDGEMKVYRRELEEDGVVVDPLKAMYTANGISAHEVVNYFFDEKTRFEWDGTIESVKVVENLADDSVIFHQMHKRVWPSTQRDSLFLSHMCTLPNAPRPDCMVGHTWMVCNFSVEHPMIQTSSKLIRLTLHIGMVCQTVAKSPVDPGSESELTRNDVSCRIIYAANVNPGGWAPPSVVRTIGKRELCKFLKKFSATVQRQTSSSPLTL